MKGRWSILAAAVLWGTTGTAQALGPATAAPPAVGAVRLLVGAVGLVAVAAAAGTLGRVREAPPGALAMTALGIAAYQPAFFAAVARAGVATGTVIAIGSAPVLAGLLARVVAGEHLDRRWWPATVLAVAGTVAVVGSPDRIDPLGALFALGAGTAYAVYAFGAKRTIAAIGPLAAMAGAFGLGALALVPVLWTADLSWVTGPAGAATALWLGFGTVTASYLLFGRGLQTTPLSVTATLSLAEPVTATVLGVVLVAERPGAAAWGGIVLVLAGLTLLASPRRGAVSPAV